MVPIYDNAVLHAQIEMATKTTHKAREDWAAALKSWLVDSHLQMKLE